MFTFLIFILLKLRMIHATVWQLVSDNGENTFNFLYGTNGLTLTLLNNRFETPKSELDYSLRKAD